MFTGELYIVTIADRTKPIVRQALISVKGFGDLPKVRQLYYFYVNPSNLITTARYAVEFVRFDFACLSRKKSIVSVIRGLTPRTGRQTYWNRVGQRAPRVHTTGLPCMERAVAVTKIN